MTIDLNSIINSVDLNSIINTVKPMIPYITLAAAPVMTVALTLGAAAYGLAALPYPQAMA